MVSLTRLSVAGDGQRYATLHNSERTPESGLPCAREGREREPFLNRFKGGESAKAAAEVAGNSEDLADINCTACASAEYPQSVLTPYCLIARPSPMITRRDSNS